MLDILGQRGKVDVEDLAAELDVSAATIRRDLDHLAEQQLLTRTRGGAVANNVAYDLPLRYKTARHATEKERIGKAAVQLASGAAWSASTAAPRPPKSPVRWPPTPSSTPARRAP